MRPSFLAHVSNGILILIAFILLYLHYQELTSEGLIGIVFLAAIAIGVHGISHHYEEIYYGFNPLKGDWILKDKPVR